MAISGFWLGSGFCPAFSRQQAGRARFIQPVNQLAEAAVVTAVESEGDARHGQLVVVAAYPPAAAIQSSCSGAL